MEILESMGVESIAQLIQVIVNLVNLGISFISSTVSMVMYCLGAWGMFAIAKRRNLPKPWLAWIPVGNSWMLGSIADQYQERINGKKTVRRKWLLGLHISVCVLAFLLLLLYTVFLVGMIVVAVFIPNRTLVMGFAVIVLLLMLAILVLLLVASVPCTVFACIAYYDLFRSCKPNLAVLFLVLTILFGNWVNIAVLIFRNSDEGMPAEQYLPEAPQEEV